MKRSPISTYFAVVVLLQSCLLFASARINYKGLVLTSIDVKPVDGKPNRVTFSGSISGSLDDKTAVFLENIDQINEKDEEGKRLFEADLVTVARAKQIINDASEDGKGKPLFCIHGFNVQPGGHLKTCKKNAPKFDKGKFCLVPVIWPSKGGVTNYGGDRETNSVGAGRAFKILKQGIDNFPSKSLLAHSMGNNVLRHAADSKFKFDNIFMAAAVRKLCWDLIFYFHFSFHLIHLDLHNIILYFSRRMFVMISSMNHILDLEMKTRRKMDYVLPKC